MPKSLLPVPMLGGVNFLEDPRKIQDDELVLAKNVAPVEPGIVSLRGAAALESTWSNATGGKPLLLKTIPFTSNADFILAARNVADGVNTYLYCFTQDGTLVILPNLEAVTVRRPAIVFWNETIYCFGGQGCPGPGLKIYNFNGGMSFSNFAFSGTDNESLRPSVACLFRGNRFIYADFGPGFEDAVVFADRNDPAAIGDATLSEDGRWFPLGNGNEGRIVAVTTIMQTAAGTPAQEAVLFLKEHAAYIMTGVPNQTADGDLDLDNMDIQRVSFDCGCVSAETVVHTPYGVMWAGADDVWAFTIGQLPARVGTKIRPKLTQADARSRYLWHAEYHNGFYRLAVPADGQVPLDDDPMGAQYWLDLRDGPPQDFRQARWWGPMVYNLYPAEGDHYSFTAGTYTMCRETRPNADHQLFSATGDVRDGLRLISMDANGSQDMGRAYDATNLYQANDIDIKTKVYDFGDPMIKKIFDGSEVNIFTQETGRLLWSTFLDEGKTVTVDNVKDIQNSSFRADVDQADEELLVREFQSLQLPADRNYRFAGKLVQYELKTAVGYLVIEGVNDKFLFGISINGIDDPTESNVQLITITPGLYADITDLADELETKMNAAYTGLGVTFTVTIDATDEVLKIACDNNAAFLAVIGLESSMFPYDANAAQIHNFLTLIGFAATENTSVNTNEILGESALSNTRAPVVQIGGLVLKIQPVRRRPE